MDQNEYISEILGLSNTPAFRVRDGVVCQVSHAAAGMQISEGTDVLSLIHTGAEEYRQFSQGRLFLTLEINGVSFSAFVFAAEDSHIFVVEEASDAAELQAFALAAKELRNPLSGLIAMADRLLPTISKENAAAQDEIMGFNRCLFQLLRVVGNMSDAGRYASVGSTRLAQHDICALAYEVFNSAAVKCKEANIALSFSVPQKPVYTLSDPDLLERAIYNLLSNAMKFTPEGGQILAQLVQRGNRLYLTVQDNGSGIDPALRGTVFQMYRRKPTIEDSRYGIGLGMVLVQSAAAVHGGAVLVEQPRDCGSRFTMTIAIRASSQPGVSSPILRVDYAGERDHALVELSDALPLRVYDPERL